MKKLKKVLLIIFLIIFIPIISVFAIRLINSFRYPEPDYGISNQATNDKYPLSNSLGEIKLVDHNRAQGFHMQPSAKKGKGIIIVFGGSEGSANYDTAYKLYEKGYEVLAMYFFGQKNQPQTLCLVEIEFLEDIQDYIAKEEIDDSPVTLLGISKGAELSLLLSQYYEQIDNVVLYAPSAYIFQGLDMKQEASSWSYNGKELPYCAFRNGSGKAITDMIGASIFGYPISYLESYRSISENISATSDEWIYKKPISGKVLVFAGGDDTMWPSAEMGEKLAKTYPDQVEFHLYDTAGHMFRAYTYASGFALGGTIEANVDAGISSDNILFERIKDWHE